MKAVEAKKVEEAQRKAEQAAAVAEKEKQAGAAKVMPAPKVSWTFSGVYSTNSTTVQSSGGHGRH
jgi:hypothetical protein